MQKKKKTSFIKGFDFAWQGILWNALNERNMRIHLFVTILVLVLGMIFQLALIEWLILLFFIALIPALELVNSAIESTCDVLRDELKLNYKATKLPRDLAAGAVLWATIFAIFTGIVIFLPYMLLLFSNLSPIITSGCL